MKFLEKIEKLKKEIKKYTKHYSIEECGIELDGSRNINCLNPNHPDKNPSMSFVEAKNYFYCHSCGTHYDIFDLASMYKNKPDKGKAFIIENVFYLADLYDIDRSYVKLKMTEEDKKKLKQYKIMQNLEKYVIKHKNEKYLKRRKIKEKTALELSIGSVDSFENLKKFLLSKEASQSEISALGIEYGKINQNKLVFIIKDKLGRPVSFSSREMKYFDIPKKISENIKKYIKENKINHKEKNKKELINIYLSSEEISFKEKKFLETNLKVPKYINGKNSLIYNKSEILYGYDAIRDDIKPFNKFYLIEGYMDFISAYQNGFTNISAFCGTGFTKGHTQILEKEKKIKKPVIAYDNDSAGKRRKNKVKKDIEENKETQLNFNIGFLKNENLGKDLDEQINNCKNIKEQDLDSFFKCYSIFEYTIQELLEKEANEEDIIDSLISGLIKTEHPLERKRRANTIAKYLSSYTSNDLIEAVEYEINLEKKDLSNKYNKIVNSYKNEVVKDPENALTIIDRMKDEIKDIKSSLLRKKKDIFESTISRIEEIEEKKEDPNNFSIKFKDPILSSMQITEGDLINIIAKANIGKTTFFTNLTNESLTYNKDTVIVYFATDDSLNDIYTNVMALNSGLKKNFIKNPKKYQSYKGYQKAFNKYLKTKEKVVKWVQQKRFSITDAKDFLDITSLETKLKTLRRSKYHKDSKIILVIDSANKIESEKPGEFEKVRFISKEIKRMTTKYDLITLQNQELKKKKNGEKIEFTDQSGGARLEYDPRAIISLHQPLHEIPEKTSLFWDLKGRRMPIVVGTIEKTKIGGEKHKPFFYKLNYFKNNLISVKKRSEYQALLKLWKDDIYNNYDNGILNNKNY